MAKTRAHRRSATAPTRAASPAPLPDVSAARVREHLSAIALLMGTFHLRHILRLYAAFDGDLVEAIVLGEIAHHNLAAIRGTARNAHELSALSRQRHESGVPALLPTNAYSIAVATGIPRETVRRKIAALLRKRFLRRDDKGGLFVTSHAREHFAMFNVEGVAELLDTCRQVESLLQGEADAGMRPRRTRQAAAPER